MLRVGWETVLRGWAGATTPALLHPSGGEDHVRFYSQYPKTLPNGVSDVDVGYGRGLLGYARFRTRKARQMGEREPRANRTRNVGLAGVGKVHREDSPASRQCSFVQEKAHPCSSKNRSLEARWFYVPTLPSYSRTIRRPYNPRISRRFIGIGQSANPVSAVQFQKRQEVSDHASIVALLTAVGDRPICFHREFARVGGSVQAGIFLSQAFYWSKRTSAGMDGWFYKETKEFEEETMLSRHEQDGARRNLREMGVLEEKRGGNHAKLHYKVNFAALAIAIAENRQWRKPAMTIAENRQSVPSVSICTENTSEITAGNECQPDPTLSRNSEFEDYQERERLAAARREIKLSRKPFQRAVKTQVERVDYAKQREADRAAKIAREDSEILANLQARSRTRGG